MAYTLDNLRTDIRNYTEVGSNVLSDTVLERLIKNAELSFKIEFIKFHLHLNAHLLNLIFVEKVPELKTQN